MLESGEPGLVYVRCPVCGSRIKEPLLADGGPQVLIHRHTSQNSGPRRVPARLVVHPARGIVVLVPEFVSLEDALLLEQKKAS